MPDTLEAPREAPSREQLAAQHAGTLLAQKPDWITFYREVLGVDGIVARLYPEAAERAAFERTEAYQELVRTLGRLRLEVPEQPTRIDSQQVITLRIPKSLHKRLREQASIARTSMNQLCIDRLLGIEAAEAVSGQ